jgi:hypothetical protein
VLEYLKDHFEFVLCEVPLSAELCSELKACATCSLWTSATDAVECELCQQAFHLGCLDPPLAKKPGLGFVFTCAPCSQRREEEYAQYYNGERTSAPSAPASARSARKGKGRAPGAPALVSTSMKTTNGWPFRYFGYHVNPLDILDPHESIYPRAASKVGVKYQTVVPEELKGSTVGSTSKLSAFRGWYWCV